MLLSCGTGAQLDGMMYGDHRSTMFFELVIGISFSAVSLAQYRFTCLIFHMLYYHGHD